MGTDTTSCGYEGCPNPGQRRHIKRIIGVGPVDFFIELCEAHYQLRDIDDDVIIVLKEKLLKQTKGN